MRVRAGRRPRSRRRRLLLRNTAHPKHALVPLDFDFADVMAVCTGGLLGHRQITDAWLVTAAVRGGMKLVTFDTDITQLLASPRERDQHVSRLGPARSR